MCVGEFVPVGLAAQWYSYSFLSQPKPRHEGHANFTEKVAYEQQLKQYEVKFTRPDVGGFFEGWYC